MKTKPWCYIPVNSGGNSKKGLKAKVDQEDLKRVSEYTWRLLKTSSGRLRVMTSFRSKKGTHQLSLGQLIMKPPRNKMVYARRFMDELDFRKSNLIVCDMSLRQQMLPKSRNFGSSRYKGVSYIAKGKKWRAQIEVDKKQIALGVFRDEVSAALAYNKAAKKFFGDLAYQNPTQRRTSSRRTKA